MKKGLKIVGISLLILLLILILVPYLFRGNIENYIKKEINKNLNAEVSWEQVDLSLIRNFPNASVGLRQLLVENMTPFEGDTLFYADKISLKMGIMQIFKNEGYVLDEVNLHQGIINLKVNADGIANWDIAKSSDTTADEDEEASNMKLDLKHYELIDSRILYQDDEAQIVFLMNEFNHTGDGDFSSSIFNLNTHTDTQVSFDYEGTNFLDKNFIQLDAVLGIDLEKMKFSFLENEALINQLALQFDGYYQLNEENAEMDIRFETPTSDFKNFLALIPAAYASSLDGVETTGNFDVQGHVHGILDEKYIPKLDIKMNSSEASFNYPDLPKKMEDIFMDIQILNTTGIVENTEVKISDARFRIDQDQFSGKLNLRNLTTNMMVDLDAKGNLDLSKISQVYPLEMDLDLNGKLTADINAKFDMDAIEKERYQDIQTQGSLLLRDFHYQDEDLPNAYDISEANVQFTTNNIRLQKFEMKTGGTDLSAKGKLDNLMGFMFDKQALKGRFTATSTRFALSDFMMPTEEESTTEASTEAIKIPDFLDIVLDFNVQRVLYDTMQLTNATGSMIIKDESARLQDVSAQLFGGTITMNGMVSTKSEEPDFDIKMGLTEIDIQQIMEQMDLAKSIAPIASALVGKVSTNFDLAGKLTPDFSPILPSLTGGALARINQATVNPQNTALLNQLNQNLDVIDFSKLKLNGLSTQASFSEGRINVQPFQVEVEGVKIDVQGSHNFDATMNYNLDLHIPARKFGSTLGSQLANLSGEDINTMQVDLPIGIGGSFTNPQLQMNMQNAIQQLTKQIIDKQKQQLRDRAQDKAESKISDLLGRGDGDKPTDTTTTKEEEKKVEDQVKDILGGMFGRNRK